MRFVALLRCVAILSLAGLALVAATGCRRATPATEAEALSLVIERESAVVESATKADPAADVADPAERAAKAYARLRVLKEKSPADPAVVAWVDQAEPRYVKLRQTAEQARERREYAGTQRGLKVRAYRAARDTVVPQLLVGAAGASRQAATTKFEELPPLVRELATSAASLASLDPQIARDGAVTDPEQWRQIATTLDQWREKEPAEFVLALAMGFVLLGKPELACVECDRLAAASVTSLPGSDANLVALVRALALSRLGFVQLAGIEADHISGKAGDGPQLLASLHLLMAFDRGSRKDWKEMDRNLAEAVRVWPNNPVVVYLSGERLLADGRREEALENFTRATQGKDGEWLGPLLAERIREVRDGREASATLLEDPRFIAKCVTHLFGEQISGPPGKDPLGQLTAAAEGLARRLFAGEAPKAESTTAPEKENPPR